MDTIKNAFYSTGSWLRQHAKAISLSLLGLFVLAIFGSVVYVQSTPQYSLYKMNQAAGKNDVAAFSKYWKVAPDPSLAADPTSPDATAPAQPSPQDAERTYHDKYYYKMSLKGAFSTTDVRREIISNGVLVFVKGKQPETAMRMVKEQGHWVVVQFAEL